MNQQAKTTERSNKKVLLWILILALVLRIIWLVLFIDLKNPQLGDAGAVARSMASGLGFRLEALTVTVPSAFVPPAVPYIYYIFFKAFGDGYAAYFLLLILNILVSLVSIWILYILTEKVYGAASAKICALFASVAPLLIIPSLSYERIVFYQALLLLAYLYFTGSISRSTKLSYTVKIGFVLGALLYFDASTLGLLLLITLLFILGKNFIRALLILGIALTILSPWVFRNYLVFDRFIPVSTGAGYMFFQGHSDDTLSLQYGTEVGKLKEDSDFEFKRSRLGYKLGISHIKENPWQEFKSSMKEVFKLWIMDKRSDLSNNFSANISWYVILILFLYGLFETVRRPEYRYQLLFPVAYLAFSTFIVIVFYNLPEIREKMAVVLLPAASFGLIRLYEILTGRQHRLHS